MSDVELPRVLVLTPDFPPEIGGIQTLVHRVTAGFTRFCPEVVTVSAANAGEFDRAQNFRIVRVPAGTARHRVRVAALNAAAIAEGIRRRPNVVLAAHVVTGPAAHALGAVLRCPVVVYTHAQELGRRPAFSRRVLARADAIVAGSQFSRSLIEEMIGPSQRIRIVHPGVDCPSAARAVGGSGVIVVARLAERYKGHDVLLRAMAIVGSRLPRATLDIVGDGPLRPELETLARELGIVGRTRFHGAVSDAERDRLLSQAAVFAMPSRVESHGAGEGFGIVYVEAGAQSLPVVAGNVGGALDAVVDGTTGLLVDPTDPQAVAGALLELLESTERANAMGQAGWEHAASLSWDRAASELETVLEETLAR